MQPRRRRHRAVRWRLNIDRATRTSRCRSGGHDPRKVSTEKLTGTKTPPERTARHVEMEAVRTVDRQLERRLTAPERHSGHIGALRPAILSSDVVPFLLPSRIPAKVAARNSTMFRWRRSLLPCRGRARAAGSPLSRSRTQEGCSAALPVKSEDAGILATLNGCVVAPKTLPIRLRRDPRRPQMTGGGSGLPGLVRARRRRSAFQRLLPPAYPRAPTPSNKDAQTDARVALARDGDSEVFARRGAPQPRSVRLAHRMTGSVGCGW